MADIPSETSYLSYLAISLGVIKRDVVGLEGHLKGKMISIYRNMLPIHFWKEVS